MEYKTIDFSRVLTFEEIENITDEEYKNILNFCKYHINKSYTVASLIGRERRNNKTGKNFRYFRMQPPTPIGPANVAMVEADRIAKTSHPLIKDLDIKKRELIYTNYAIRDNKMFINYILKLLNETQYSSIQDFIDQINLLKHLYENNNQKFILYKTITKINEKIKPIMDFFVEYFQINDPVIIINKVNEIIVKHPELLDEDVKCIQKII